MGGARRARHIFVPPGVFGETCRVTIYGAQVTTPCTCQISRVDSASFAVSIAGDIAGLVAQTTAADGRSPLNEQAMLSLQHSSLASASLWTARSESGPGTELVGFALCDLAPEAAGGSPAASAAAVEVNLVVAPTARGRGVGRALAEMVLEAFPAARITAWSHGNHPAASVLGPALGFSRVRDLWVMRRSMADPLPAVEVPASTVVRTFEAGRDEDAVLRVNAAAFAHHLEQGDLSRADLDLRMSEPWFDPAGFFLAEAAGTSDLLGFHWTKVHAEAPAYGEVYVVGISPDAQGKGLGKVLTLTGLHHLQEVGLGEVILYVESDNAPAIAVYERLGFRHVEADTDVMYSRKPVG